MDKEIIAVDFDGTIVKQNDDIDSVEFELLPNAKEVIQWLYNNFYTILWTCREGIYLQNAVDYLSLQGLQFHAINANVPMTSFKTSSKIFAHSYIDDRGYGANIDWLKIKDFFSTKLMTDEDIVKNVVITIVGD